MDSAPRATRYFFEFWVLATRIVGAALFVLSGFIFGSVKGGLKWGHEGKGNSGGLNYHGLCMTLGMLYFNGEALMAYRVNRYERKFASKLLHGTLHLIVIVLITIAIIAVVDGKNENGNKHFYSPHSWLGLAIMAVYLTQFTFGLLTYALPFATLPIRRSFMPFHRAVGVGCFVAATGQVLSGMQAYSIYTQQTLSCTYTLGCYTNVEVLLNFNFLFAILYSLGVLTTVGVDVWKRRTTPDERLNVKED